MWTLQLGSFEHDEGDRWGYGTYESSQNQLCAVELDSDYKRCVSPHAEPPKRCIAVCLPAGFC